MLNVELPDQWVHQHCHSPCTYFLFFLGRGFFSIMFLGVECGVSTEERHSWSICERRQQSIAGKIFFLSMPSPETGCQPALYSKGGLNSTFVHQLAHGSINRPLGTKRKTLSIPLVFSSFSSLHSLSPLLTFTPTL